MVSLVACYGPKPEPLANLLADCRSRLQQADFGRFFQPYDVAQMHFTLLGLERRGDLPQSANAPAPAPRQSPRTVEVEALLRCVRNHPGFLVRLGGFDPADTSFSSFGKSPHEAAFQIHMTSGKAVLKGWHHQEGDFSHRADLWRFRQDLETHSLEAHKYPDDADFYCVLGRVVPIEESPSEAKDPSAREGAARSAERDLQRHLARSCRLDVTLGPAQMQFVHYRDPRLPLDSTRAYSAVDPSVTPSFIEALCGDGENRGRLGP
jgi:hypothetical protein